MEQSVLLRTYYKITIGKFKVTMDLVMTIISCLEITSTGYHDDGVFITGGKVFAFSGFSDYPKNAKNIKTRFSGDSFHLFQP